MTWTPLSDRPQLMQVKATWPMASSCMSSNHCDVLNMYFVKCLLGRKASFTMIQYMVKNILERGCFRFLCSLARAGQLGFPVWAVSKSLLRGFAKYWGVLPPRFKEQSDVISLCKSVYCQLNYCLWSREGQRERIPNTNWGFQGRASQFWKYTCKIFLLSLWKRFFADWVFFFKKT